MTLLYIAIPVALLVAAGAVIAFIWAARGDQYEDLDTPPAKPTAGATTPVASAHGQSRASDADAPRVPS